MLFYSSLIITKFKTHFPKYEKLLNTREIFPLCIFLENQQIRNYSGICKIIRGCSRTTIKTKLRKTAAVSCLLGRITQSKFLSCFKKKGCCQKMAFVSFKTRRELEDLPQALMFKQLFIPFRKENLQQQICKSEKGSVDMIAGKIIYSLITG